MAVFCEIGIFSMTYHAAMPDNAHRPSENYHAPKDIVEQVLRASVSEQEYTLRDVLQQNECVVHDHPDAQVLLHDIEQLEEHDRICGIDPRSDARLRMLTMQLSLMVALHPCINPTIEHLLLQRRNIRKHLKNHMHRSAQYMHN